MPKKLPAAYVRKLNKEQKTARLTAAKRMAERPKQQDPDSGKLKAFTMICQSCGTRAKFTVDSFGYATCNNCRAIASYKLGPVA